MVVGKVVFSWKIIKSIIKYKLSIKCKNYMRKHTIKATLNLRIFVKMEEIKFCPHRTRKVRKPTDDGGWIETKDFMTCIGDDCPYFYIQESGDIFNPSFREKCKKSKKKKKKDKYWIKGDDF